MKYDPGSEKSRIISQPILVDCTLRDGGYYNSWDFDLNLVQAYLNAMAVVGVGYVELGFRSIKNIGFKGAFAYTTDSYIKSLSVPSSLKLGVMVNACEVIAYKDGWREAVMQMFSQAKESPVELVRIAAHNKDLHEALEVSKLLKSMGYVTGINLMQITELSNEELQYASELVSKYQPDVFYFADSIGSLLPDQVDGLVNNLRKHWSGALGIHAHNNLGNALACALVSLKYGTTWIDGTVAGMGRGAGNTPTEYLVMELDGESNRKSHGVTTLLTLIENYFRSLQSRYNWGMNPYYYMAGKHGVHPTYIQEMLGDARYDDEDILAVIQYLQHIGGANYSPALLESGRHHFSCTTKGTWHPEEMIVGSEVLIIGAGPSAKNHAEALEEYIRVHRPFVMVLNAIDVIDADLVDVRAACHPMRMLADCDHYMGFPQPLITPTSVLPEAVKHSLSEVKLLDFGLNVVPDHFTFYSSHCIVPAPLVIAYALAIASSGKASRILLAGFDGYGADDPRRTEIDALFRLFGESSKIPFSSVTPTKFKISSVSIYGMGNNINNGGH